MKIKTKSIEQIGRINAIQSKMDRWQLALDWARMHGARIRRGKVSKDLACVRIYKAGLMNQWNKEFPELAFDLTDLQKSKYYLAKCDSLYALRGKHRRT